MKGLFLSLSMLLLGSVALAQADRSKARNAGDSVSTMPNYRKLRKRLVPAKSAGWGRDSVAGRQNLFERHCAECRQRRGREEGTEPGSFPKFKMRHRDSFLVLRTVWCSRMPVVEAAGSCAALAIW